jgi:hypothetical protein
LKRSHEDSAMNRPVAGGAVQRALGGVAVGAVVGADGVVGAEDAEVPRLARLAQVGAEEPPFPFLSFFSSCVEKTPSPWTASWAASSWSG